MSAGTDQSICKKRRSLEAVAGWIDNAVNIMEAIRKDYDHEWPNEDEGTQMHRKIILHKITTLLNVKYNNSKTKNIKINI